MYIKLNALTHTLTHTLLLDKAVLRKQRVGVSMQF
jgi:hypothetical protein